MWNANFEGNLVGFQWILMWNAKFEGNLVDFRWILADFCGFLVDFDVECRFLVKLDGFLVECQFSVKFGGFSVDF